MQLNISNITLNLQAAINRMTRRARKARQYRNTWNDYKKYATGSLLGDALLGSAFGLVFLAWVIS